MSIIWLISQDDSLPALLTQLLRKPVTITRFKTAVSAFEQLAVDSASAEPVERVDLILWDVVDKLMAVSAHGMAQIELPVIAILSDAGLRTAVLAAGAVDYLLRPFVPHEITTRLAPYLGTLINPLRFMLTTLEIMQEGISFLQALTESLEMVWAMDGVLSASLFLWEDDRQDYLSLLPMIVSQGVDEMGEETAVVIDDEDLLAALALPHPPRLTTISTDQIAIPLPNTPALLILPLLTDGKTMGLILFRCSYTPALGITEREALRMLGQLIGNLLALSHMQEEAQSYAIQTAFMVLIAKMLAELSDQETILTTTMEHVASLLNAAGSAIWLLQDDKQTLKLASVMSDGSARNPAAIIPAGKGIVGWVAQNNELLNITNPSQHELFHAEYDYAIAHDATQAISIPLFHQEMIGVMQVYNANGRQFSQHDIVLLEGIGGLLSSAIINAQLVLHLRDQAEQQQILYEMSRQLASALELPVTLHRAIAWSMRLSHVDIGLLWMFDEETQRMKLAASQGLQLDMPTQKTQLAEQSVLLTELMKSAQTVIIEELSPDEPYFMALNERFPLNVQNMIIIPIVYRREIIGVLNLVNKQGDGFNHADKLLLSLASDMVAIAIGNARLHTRAVMLMDERQRLNRYAMQTERLATVGRLTASLAHEINNPMQAIKGAMDLIFEEADDPESVGVYAQLAYRQAARVTDLVERMQRIYRPQGEDPEVVVVNTLLHDTIVDARKEMLRQSVKLETDFAGGMRPVWVTAHQLHLVFLNIILHLAVEIGEADGGLLEVRSGEFEEWVRVEFITAVSIPALQNLLNDNPENTPRQINFGLSFSQDIVQAYDGQLELLLVEGKLVVRIDLPPMNE